MEGREGSDVMEWSGETPKAAGSSEGKCSELGMAVCVCTGMCAGVAGVS